MQNWKEVNVWSSTVYSCDFHEGRQHFITLLMFVLNFVLFFKGAADLKRLCYLKKIILLVIYIFRGHIRACMKGNEMLFEILYIFCGL